MLDGAYKRVDTIEKAINGFQSPGIETLDHLFLITTTFFQQSSSAKKNAIQNVSPDSLMDSEEKTRIPQHRSLSPEIHIQSANGIQEYKTLLLSSTNEVSSDDDLTLIWLASNN